MARVGRLAGALLAETDDQYFLVGDLKEPADFEAAGFASPGEIDAVQRPYVELEPRGKVELAPPYLVLGTEGEALAAMLAHRFLIRRNGSVSERLWMVVTQPHGEEVDPEDEVDARWLGEMPAPVWDVVRDAVLRCT